jgi:30S ribosomal protein S31
MGKGDVRTRRGKIYNGSFGKTRPHKLAKKKPVHGAAAPKR